MVCDVAQRISGITEQDVIVISGSREFNRATISVLVQCDVKVADVLEDVNGIAVRTPLSCFLDDIVPQRTEFVFEFRESM
jgi:hypothetical protein